MIRPLLLLFASLALPIGLAHGDMIILQRVEGEGKTGEMRIEIKGTKVRVDVSPQFTALKDTATGEEWTLVHEQKAFLRVTPEATAAVRDEMEKARASKSPAPGPAKLLATGKSEKVRGQETQIFTATSGNLEARYWIAPKYPEAPALLAQMAILEQGTLAELSRGLLPTFQEMPGFPLKTEVTLQGRKTTTTILSAKEEPIEDERFVVPAEYQELSSAILPPKQP